MSKSSKSGRYRSSWIEAKRIIWSRRWRLLLGLGLVLINRLTGMVLPALIKVIIDVVIGQQRSDLLLWVAIGGASAGVIQGTTSFALTQILGIAAQRSINELRERIQARIGRLPIRYFDTHRSGELISRIMTDAEGIRNLVGTGFVTLVGGLLTASLSLCALIYLNWRLTAIIMGALVIFGGIMFKGFSYIRPLFRDRGKLNADLTGRLNEFLGGIRVVKAYTAEKREELTFTRNTHKLFRIIVKSMTAQSVVLALSTTLMACIGVTMLVVGAHEALSGRMTVGDIVTFGGYTVLIITPIVQINAIGTQLTEALAGLDRIQELMAEPLETADDEKRERIGAVRGDVTFEHVCFEYHPGTPVLRGVSFFAPAGTTTAFVGSSGSGKSTLISIIMAFNRVTSGRILVDGRDLSTIRLHDYRANLGIVLQDNFLFDGTIAENIRYSNPRATMEEVIRAAKIAHCDEFAERFEQKYETLIGERGVRVSGGQRQRIAIARAILADPHILILDEATSSLDSESEAMIQDGLNILRKGRTTFVIAHRLSTIRNADQILVLEAGEIVERGTHAELLLAEGRYRTLYNKQYKLEMDRFVNPGEDDPKEIEKDSEAT